MDLTLQDKKWINNKGIEDYEKELSGQYGPLFLREARNLNNESALAIIMPNKCPLRDMLNNSEEIGFFQTRIEDDKKTGKPYTIVCIPEDNLHHFKNFIFNHKIEEVNTLARDYGESYATLVSQLTDSMIQDKNPDQHFETLNIINIHAPNSEDNLNLFINKFCNHSPRSATLWPTVVMQPLQY
ncbi:MAG: hypothetical protein H0U73_13650 [Tatlockia sp.]|nr:hypothetical protein [Tatlockia sp.]